LGLNRVAEQVENPVDNVGHFCRSFRECVSGSWSPGCPANW
jgi:hypothetical protein